MAEVTLDGEDERRRAACQSEAIRHWPGARVLVHSGGERYLAAVHLPEDGVDLAASAERSELRDSVREALEELRGLIERQKSPLTS